MASTARHSGLRLLADLLLIAGGLLLSYPFWSGAYAACQQHRLDHAYAGQERTFAGVVRAHDGALAELRDPQVRAQRLSRLYARTLKTGDPVGRLRIPRIGVDTIVLEGRSGRAGLGFASDRALLRQGPVHYGNTPLPGAGEPFAVAGHRTTYGAPFYHLDELHSGDRITVDLPYGRFSYVVAKTSVVLPNDVTVLYDRGYGLVLTTCTPPYSASHRLVVWGKVENVVLR